MTVRPLNTIEKYQVSRITHRVFHTFATWAEYVRPLELSEIQSVLEHIVEKHAFFRQALNSAHELITLENVDVTNQIMFIDNADLDDFCSSIVAEDFHPDPDNLTEETLLWRVFFIKELRVVVLQCDHTIFDGTSALNFHILFAEVLAGKRIELEVPFTDATELIDYTPSIWRLVQVVVGGKYNDIWGRRNLFRLESPFIRAPPHSKTLHVSSERTKSLIDACRREGVRLTSLIAAIEIFSTNASQKDTTCAIPISLRPWFDIDQAHEKYPGFEPDFGLYMTAVELFVSAGSNFDWVAVRDFHKRLHAQVGPQAAKNIGLLQFVDADAYIDSVLAKPRETTYEVSNLGVAKTNDLVERCGFMQAPSTGGYYCTNVVGHRQGLTINLTCIEQIDPAEFFDNFEKLLDSID